MNIMWIYLSALLAAYLVWNLLLPWLRVRLAFLQLPSDTYFLGYRPLRGSYFKIVADHANPMEVNIKRVQQLAGDSRVILSNLDKHPMLVIRNSVLVAAFMQSNSFIKNTRIKGLFS